jgi:tape measure domain-containing protein
MAGRGAVVVDFNANIARFVSSVDKISNDLSRFQTNADRVAKNVDRSFARLGSSVKGVFGGLAAGLSVRELATMADSFSNIQARLKLATRDANEFAQANENIKRISSSSQSGLQETATLYTRISQSLLDVGGTQKQVADVTQALAVSLRLSGATAAESASAMLQFSQAISSGVLRGEEFNAVNEAAPRAMKALADSLNVPVGKLREMAQEGKITRDILVDALGSQLPKLLKEAETLPNTIGAAFQSLKNELLLSVGLLDQVTGASSKAASGIGLIGQAFKGWRDAIGDSGPDSAISDRLKEVEGLMDSALKVRKLFNTLGLKPPAGADDNYLNQLNRQALELKKNLEQIRNTSSTPEDGEDAGERLRKSMLAAEAEAKRKAAAEDSEKAIKALVSRQKTFIDGLQKEAETLGMSASQMKVYEAGLLKISGAQLDGVKASAERIEAFNRQQDALKDQISFEAQQADQFYQARDKAANEARQSLEALNKEGQNLKLSVDPMARMNAEIERYSVLLKQGAIDQKTFDMAVAQSTDNMKKAATDGFGKMSAAMIGFQTNVQSTFGQGLYNVMTGKFDNVFDAWLDLLARMASAGLASRVTESIFGENGKGGLLKAGLSILGSLGSLGKAPAGGALGSSTFGQSLWPVPKFAAGGDFMGGLRLVGENGPELEATGPSRIFNAKQTKDIMSGGGRGVSVNYSPVIQIDSRTDRNEVHAIVSRAVKQGNADLVDKMSRQGLL